MVRNAVDVVRVCVLHHLTAGLERITVVDNGSSDGTTAVLRRLAERVPLRYSVDPGAYRQDEVFTELAREAAGQGADWVLPLGGDEFYLPARPLPELLAPVRDPALSTVVTHFAQRRSQRRRGARALLTMTARPARQVEQREGIRLVRQRKVAWIEVEHPTRIVARASADLALDHGAHNVAGLEPRHTAELELLHAPLRAPSVLHQKAEFGRRAAERARGDQSWHLIRWAELEERGELDAEWNANSYEDAHLDVHGVRHPVVEDLRLREIVKPWIRSPARHVAARLMRRTY
jgi:glycosyltransferase involved in cell wall biosynthesis